MKSFIDTLIERTLNGDLDYVWHWSNDKYTFQLTKHPLSGLNFTLEYGGKKGEISDNQILVFANGYGIEYPTDKILELQDAIIESLERTVIDSQKNYVNPVVVEEDESVEPTQSNKIQEKP